MSAKRRAAAHEVHVWLLTLGKRARDTQAVGYADAVRLVSAIIGSTPAELPMVKQRMRHALWEHDLPDGRIPFRLLPQAMYYYFTYNLDSEISHHRGPSTSQYQNERELMLFITFPSCVC